MAVDVGPDLRRTRATAERRRCGRHGRRTAVPRSACTMLSKGTHLGRRSSPAEIPTMAPPTVDSVDLPFHNQVTVVTSTLQWHQRIPDQDVRQRAECPASHGRRTCDRGVHGADRQAAPAFPLAISDSCYNLSGADATGRSPEDQVQARQRNLHGPPRATQIPGGWGWLDHTGGPCVAATELVATVGLRTPVQQPPVPAMPTVYGWEDTIAAGGEVEVTFPVFDDASGTGPERLVPHQRLRHLQDHRAGSSGRRTTSTYFATRPGDPGRSADLRMHRKLTAALSANS